MANLDKHRTFHTKPQLRRVSRVDMSNSLSSNNVNSTVTIHLFVLNFVILVEPYKARIPRI